MPWFTAMSTHSWLKSSVTVRHWMRRPLAKLSLTKSMLHTSLTLRHSCSGTRSSFRRCLPRRLRTDRSAIL